MTTASTVKDALAWLERRGSARNRDGMARYGIVASRAFGVSVADIQRLARDLGRDHALALALWESGWYEARLLAAFVDEPAAVTVRQMNAWARSFENWGDCDTVCMHLFDRTPLAWGRVDAWAGARAEFVKRAAFALLASLALHDKKTEDDAFLSRLPLLHAAASDERNFVKKGVSWALRSIGHRNRALHAAALALASELSASSDATTRWIGRDAARDLARPAVLAKVKRRSAT